MTSNVLDDQDYFYERAEQELDRAQQAQHPGAVRSHYLLANYYLERHYAKGEPSTESAERASAA